MKVKRRSSLVEVGNRSDGLISSENSSLHGTDGGSVKSLHPLSIHENSTGEDFSGESPCKLLRVSSPNAGCSHKVSQSRIKKSYDQKCLIVDESLGKQVRKTKDMESPSRKTATIFSSMELSTGNGISRIQFGQEDTTMPDVDDKNDFFLNFEENAKSECVPACSGEESLYNESIICSIENQSDKDMLWAQRGEHPQEITPTVCPNHPSIPTSYNSMEKSRKKYTGGPADPNGRFKGRKLVLWHRPRMMEKLLLNIQYECFKAKIRIPWDEIVHRLEPGCSGPSAVQMLNKMRDVLIIEGHMIPPAMGNGIQPDPDVRGYVRDLNAEVPGSTRILRWTENYPNASRSLSDSGFVRGSGNYRKVVTRGGAFNKIPRTIEERGHARKVIPEEAYSPSNTCRGQNGGKSINDNPAANSRRGKPRSLWKKPGPKPRSKSKSECQFTLESQTTENFFKRPKIDKICQSSGNENDSLSIFRLSSEQNSLRANSSSEEIDLIKYQKLRQSSQSSSRNWPSSDEVFRSASENQFCEVKGGNMTIRLSPVALARIELGLPIHNSNPLGGQLMDGIDGLPHQEQRGARYFMKSESHKKVSKQVGSQSYKGVEEHGTLPDFVQALASGRDPRINGWKYLRLAERLDKIKEPDIANDVSRGATSVELSNSNELLKNSIRNNKSIPQNTLRSSWPFTDLAPELHSSLKLIADDLSAEYRLTQQTRLFEDLSQENHNSITEVGSSSHDSIPALVDAQKEQQEDRRSQVCVDTKGIGYIENDFFSSPAEIQNDSAHECQFLLGGTVFEDLVTDPEPISHPRPAVFDFYGDNENIPEENYQITAWQSEFLNEPEDEVPVLQDP